MCGIVGLFSVNLPTEGEELIKQMLEVQHHRGPDATGIKKMNHCILGHNRLSIIDLSHNADQPFVYQDITIAYNGEVYNYVELREELKILGFHFETTSDTEVICAAYKAWGTECVKRFVGMWAFALWDEAMQQFFCSRDRFGIKPFNYTILDGVFYFASELNTLLQIPGLDKSINKQQAARGLNLGVVGYKEETYYQHIKQLRGSHNLVWKDGETAINRYWDLEKVEVPKNEDEAIDKFQTMFNESINIHMRADVPVGSCLSGGIDSSSIVASIAQNHKELNFETFTIFYTDKGAVDERPFAEQLPKKYNNVKPHYSEPSVKDIEHEFQSFLKSVDIPPSSSSFYSQYFVMQLAAKNKMKVLINGQGSDEFLVGYLHSYIRILADYLRKFQLIRFFKTLFFHKKTHKVSIVELIRKAALSLLLVFVDENRFVRFELKNKFRQFPDFNYDSSTIELENKFDSRLDNFLYHLLMTTTLPTLLHFEDRTSMAFSIESRVPFLDHRLVEYGFSLPVEWRLKNGLTKNVLREAMKDVLPEKIYERKDKKGFVTPGEKRWVDGPLSSYFTRNDKNIMLNWRINVLEIWKKRIGNGDFNK